MEKLNAKVFLTVVETGSFRRAADELGYTQAGISYIIHSMEEEMGLSLFIRDRTGVRLSAQGRALLPRIRQLEIDEHRLRQTINELKGLQKGTLRVQVFDSVSIHWIPGIIRRFRKDYPGIRIELISEEDSRKAEQMVYTGEVDCGFFLTDVTMDLETFPLREEHMLAIVSTDHPLADAANFPVAELDKHPYICMKYDDHTGIRHIFDRYGVEPQIAFQMDNDYAAMAMVSQGLGYCIFPELLLTDIPYALRCLEFDHPQTRVIRLGTRSMETATEACRKFIEYARKWCAEQENTVYPQS